MEKIISNNNFDEVKESKGKVLVDFYADWCGPCKMLMPVMEEISKDYDVYKVNVDQNSDLAQQFGVMSIPTVMIFEDGQEANKFVGIKTKNEILELLK